MSFGSFYFSIGRFTLRIITGRKLMLLTTVLFSLSTYGQQSASAKRALTDSNAAAITALPVKYISQVNAKIDKYSDRLSSKTEKTLEKLAKWENKIHGLLQKADPVAAEKLFGAGKTTFAAMLQRVKDGKTLTENYKAKYDGYRDKLEVNLAYANSRKSELDKKYVQPLKTSKEKIKTLEENVSESEAAQKLIRERKKELMAEGVKTLGKSKYLSKINKEAYYYTATLKNYKEIFHDPAKAEAAAAAVLNKIPAFSSFMRQNSGLSSMFGSGSAGTQTQSIAGLQTRANVNALIQARIAQGGPGAAAAVSQSMQQGQAQLQSLKSKVIKAGGSGSNDELPDFKPNSQRSKTFKQRLELGSNFQFGRPNRYTRSIADIGLSIGYKLNDKSTAGIGVAYKMGYGSISKLHISHEGIGLRSFLDYKFKKQFYISGGFELNYNTVFTNLRSLENKDAWQQSGLLGISKKIKLKTKFTKATKFQLLYDFLYKTHTVATQPVVFRAGYDFK